MHNDPDVWQQFGKMTVEIAQLSTQPASHACFISERRCRASMQQSVEANANWLDGCDLLLQKGCHRSIYHDIRQQIPTMVTQLEHRLLEPKWLRISLSIYIYIFPSLLLSFSVSFHLTAFCIKQASSHMCRVSVCSASR